MFEVGIAALELPGITDATYRVTVTNAPDGGGEQVWQLELDADRFGDGRGAISYVGPCDASDGGASSVTLELLDLQVGAASLPDDQYVNPCGELDWSGAPTLLAGEDPHGPCIINATCRENTDTPIRFDLTVLRNAQQGFFDVAVNFEDVFCSAKLDCADALLFDGAERAPTAVVAFACTSGVSQPTQLYVSDLTLTCASGPVTIPATLMPGQHGALGAGVYQSAVYLGNEELTSDGAPIEKCYWNRAIGLDLDTLVGPCTLSGVATASAEGLDAATLTTQGHSYPVVTFNVEVVDADGGLCAEHSLGAPDSGVQVDYVGSADGALVATLLPPAGEVYICGSPAPIDCVAGPTVDGQPLPVTVSAAATPGTFTVTTGTQSTTVALDPGFTLGAACRQDSCCEGD